MHTFIPWLLTVMLLCCASCSDPVDPGEPEPPPVHVQQDTTGHDIDWTVYTFGPGIPSSSLRDVIAFSDTNVWFVGKVYSGTPDSTGRYGDPYNLLRWNGREWRKDRIMVDQCRGSGYTKFGHLWSIAGPPHDIWMSNGGGTGARSDGVNFTPSCFQADSSGRYGALSFDIVYISDNRVYFAGSAEDFSEITLYNNGGFRRIAYIPGMTPIHSLAVDHWGNVWAAGYSMGTRKSCFLWRTPDGVVHDLMKDIYIEADWPFHTVSSVWISEDTLYGAANGYLYIQALYDTSHYRFVSERISEPPYGHKNVIGGTGDNDVFMAGHFGTVTHYNGKSVRSYPGLSRQFTVGAILHGIAVTQDYVYVCGTDVQTRAVIAIGKKRW